MRKLVRMISLVIILLGMVHIAYAFPIQLTTDTLWFVGAGVAIIFAGLINVVAIHKGGSAFTHNIALVANALMCGLFCFALLVLQEPQVYFGALIFLVTTIVFAISRGRTNKYFSD